LLKFTIYNADVFDGLKCIESNSVDCVVTSPPYFRLRDYGVEGQIGLEGNPKEWIQKMVAVMREVRRVLKPTGSAWLNVGDTYFAKRPKDNVKDDYYGPGRDGGHPTSMVPDGSGWLQPKQKMLMPHRLAIALQDDGWIVRNDVCWFKPSHLPSSVKDRLTNSFEFIFHLVKSKKYFYDLDAIREPHQVGAQPFNYRVRSVAEGKIKSAQYHASESEIAYRMQLRSLKEYGGKESPQGTIKSFDVEGGKNPFDFWKISSEPYPESHFAVFPTELVRRPLLATCPKWICKKCGKPRQRIVEKKPINIRKHELHKGRLKDAVDGNNPQYQVHGYERTGVQFEYDRKTVGWSDCGCGAGWTSGVVLDPFVGSGTTLQVAQELGLNGIGIELNPNYIKFIKARLNGDKFQQSLNENKIEVIVP